MEYILLTLLIIAVFVIGRAVYRRTKSKENEDIILLADKNFMANNYQVLGLEVLQRWTKRI